MVGIKYVLCALGGAVVGAGVTAAVLEKRHKKFVEETLKKAKETRENIAKVKESLDGNDGGFEAIQEEAEKYKALYFDVLRKGYVTESNYVEKEPPVSLAPEEEPRSELDSYAITVADFMDDARYGKVYCEYYRDTGTLVDTMKDESLVPEDALGDMYELLDGWVGNELYIRNIRTNLDYQIDFLPGSYKEDTGS